MDRASQVLAQGVPFGVPKSYRALADHRGVPRSTLHHRARGRRSLEEKVRSQQYLYPWKENAFVKFLLLMSDFEQFVQMKFISSLTFNFTHQRFLSNRSQKFSDRNWAKTLKRRYSILQARRVRSLNWNRHEKNIYNKVIHWFEMIDKILQNPAIVAKNVYNMNEIEIMLSMPGSVKVLIDKNDRRDYRNARIKRTTMIAIECINADDRYLKSMIIWSIIIYRSNWIIFFILEWQYACFEFEYIDFKINLKWFTQIFDFQTKKRINQQSRILICDGFETHETLEILDFCFENQIILCRLPSHTSHWLQLCDRAIFAHLKSAYRERVDRLERGGVNTIDKKHFTSLYSPARETAFTTKNIKAGFAAYGLVPFNPDRVLRDIPEPPIEPISSKANEVTV